MGVGDGQLQGLVRQAHEQRRDGPSAHARIDHQSLVFSFRQIIGRAAPVVQLPEPRAQEGDPVPVPPVLPEEPGPELPVGIGGLPGGVARHGLGIIIMLMDIARRVFGAPDGGAAGQQGGGHDPGARPGLRALPGHDPGDGDEGVVHRVEGPEGDVLRRPDGQRIPGAADGGRRRPHVGVAGAVMPGAHAPHAQTREVDPLAVHRIFPDKLLQEGHERRLELRRGEILSRGGLGGQHVAGSVRLLRRLRPDNRSPVPRHLDLIVLSPLPGAVEKDHQGVFLLLLQGGGEQAVPDPVPGSVRIFPGQEGIAQFHEMGVQLAFFCHWLLLSPQMDCVLRTRELALPRIVPCGT